MRKCSASILIICKYYLYQHKYYSRLLRTLKYILLTRAYKAPFAYPYLSRSKDNLIKAEQSEPKGSLDKAIGHDIVPYKQR